MDFFDAQDHARRMTRWLVVVYVVATLLIVAGVTTVVAAAVYGVGPGVTPDARLLAAAALITLAVILGATVYRSARLSAGGSRVAEELGGVAVTDDESDPQRRRFRNVVEEMSIASGVPVPAIYVLEQESAINAFAAGFTPGDAAIAVTRGTLEHLDRDELQGVVAHEFSHVLNGDMRLNIRMMGVLFGIMVIGLIGRMILRGGSRTGLRVGRRGKGSGGVVLVGLGLAVLGWVGVLLARIIKAAVSRQREYLADASAVQFTRQTDGIANALKKIGGYSAHSYLQAADAEEISHMLFALGARFSSLFATHPPLTRRIRALDPHFDESQYPQVTVSPPSADESRRDGRAAGFAAAPASMRVDAGTLPDAVGHPGPEHIAYAGQLHASLPDELLAAAHSPDTAWLLVLALLLDEDPPRARPMLGRLEARIGEQRGALLHRYHGEITALGPRFRLALLELSFPAIRRSGADRQEFLLDTGRQLIESDGAISLREFCLFRVLERGLDENRSPSRRRRRKPASSRAVRAAALDLLQILAHRGQAGRSAQAQAFAAGLKHFGDWSRDATFDPDRPGDAATLDRALDVLARTSPKAMRTLLDAASSTVVADGDVSVAEAEILRTLCACLGLPMPPLLDTMSNPRTDPQAIGAPVSVQPATE